MTDRNYHRELLEENIALRKQLQDCQLQMQCAYSQAYDNAIDRAVAIVEESPWFYNDKAQIAAVINGLKARK